MYSAPGMGDLFPDKDTKIMKTISNILLVDDEPEFQRLCGEWLSGFGYHVGIAGDAQQVEKCLQDKVYDMVLLDLALPPSFSPDEGFRILEKIIGIPVVILTGHADNQLALKALDLGAWDFLAKPLNPDMLRVVVERALVKRRLEKELHTLKQQQHQDTGLLGNSPGMVALRQLIHRVAPADLSVLITGPSGTGKELVAKALHQLSKRKANPFVAVHSAAISSELIESELFGHVKGAFTNAHRDRAGLVTMADGGTLFFDEVGDMSAQMQVKLLRFLQEGTYYPVGSSVEQRADVRVVAATHRDMLARVNAKHFREDLYYRLKGVELNTKSLKDQLEDIPELTRKFVHGQHCRIDQTTIDWLLHQEWPGNVRELYNVLAFATSLCRSGEVVQFTDIQLAKNNHQNESISHQQHQTLEEHIQKLEKILIISALESTGHNHTHTADRLGISRVGLLKKMKRLGLR